MVSFLFPFCQLAERKESQKLSRFPYQRHMCRKEISTIVLLFFIAPVGVVAALPRAGTAPPINWMPWLIESRFCCRPLGGMTNDCSNLSPLLSPPRCMLSDWGWFNKEVLSSTIISVYFKVAKIQSIYGQHFLIFTIASKTTGNNLQQGYVHPLIKDYNSKGWPIFFQRWYEYRFSICLPGQ